MLRLSESLRPSRCLALLVLASLASSAQAGNLVRNGTFEDDKAGPFIVTFAAPAKGKSSASAGELCVDVESAGVEPWDVTLRQRALNLQKGHAYAVSFKVHSSRPTKIRAKLGEVGPPYGVYWQKDVAVSTEQTVTAQVTGDDPNAELAIQVGGALAAGTFPLKVCIAQVVIDDPQYTAPAPPPKLIVPGIIVDPLGYFPHGTKRAMVKSAQTAPQPWKLMDGDKVAASGTTTVYGKDAASGETLHQANFSSYTTPGKDLVLLVGKDISTKFAISTTPYGALKYDALSFFFQQRSGVEIPASLVGEQWARKAGHPGDVKLGCTPKCDYTLDVHGGWYDAGDHGKYVVNGGIATWMLLGLYERTKILGTSVDALGDGKLKIPESKNGVPDILDEARFELEFLMRMQVPAGKPLAGMAHHKLHSEKWTPIPTHPAEDPAPRFLHAPSTAATLNLAAVGAQCARIYKPFDAAFAATCLESAERAWTAAKANPAKYASPEDTVGGGAYEDNDVSDEFYWAAAELFISTGKQVYKDEISKSKYFGIVDSGTAAMTWQHVQGLGTISLAVVPNGLGKGEVDKARGSIKQAADQYLQTIEKEGYRTPLRAGTYPWGSNSIVLDDAVILSLAYDFGHDDKYLDGTREAVSYIMGRNPVAQTYVTGYGLNPLHNPHHRFWAQQSNPSFPPAPPGLVSGGPNSGLEDPYARGLLLGSPAQKCFVDNIESYSTNEIAINWNAPLVWAVTFLDEQAK